jgi:hypothetical protein
MASEQKNLSVNEEHVHEDSEVKKAMIETADNLPISGGWQAESKAEEKESKINFKIDLGPEPDRAIPIFIGKGGQNIKSNVIMAAIFELKQQKVPQHSADSQEILDSVKAGKIKIYKKIMIKDTGVGQIASWNDTKELGHLNIDLNELLKKHLTKHASNVCDRLKENMSTGSNKVTEKKFRKNFNYRIGLDDGTATIGQFIGNGGEVINAFKEKIAEELGVEKVFVKIVKWTSDMLEMYRAIGNMCYTDGCEEYFLFKISFLGGERSDILKVEKMLIDFVNVTLSDDVGNVEEETTDEED